MSCFSKGVFSPSPPIMKWALGCTAKTCGIMSIRKSIPLRYVKREMQTIFIVLSGNLKLGFG